MWQSGRLIVEIFAFLDYSRLVASTRVNQQFRKVLKTGIRHLTITNPAKLGAPIADVLTQFPSLTRLDGTVTQTVPVHSTHEPRTGN